MQFESDMQYIKCRLVGKVIDNSYVYLVITYTDYYGFVCVYELYLLRYFGLYCVLIF